MLRPRRWTDAMEAEGLSLDWYVHRHRTERRGPAVGPPDRRAAQGLPVGRLAGRARRQRARGLPVDAVLRLRGVHRLRDRARRGVARAAGRRQPGHRTGPRPWRRRPGAGAGCADEAADPLRQARQGPLHEPPRHGADLGAGAAPGRPAGGDERRVHAAARGSASAWPCRPAPSRSPSTSTSSSSTERIRRSRAVPERLTDVLPAGFTALVAAEPSTAGGIVAGERHVGDVGARRARRFSTSARRRSAAARRGRAPARAGAQGRASGRRRPPADRVAGGRPADGTTMVAELATIGRGLRPAELAAVAFPAAESRRCGCCGHINGSSTTETGAGVRAAGRRAGAPVGA